ncbi:MAG: 50S ribosomal protein L13 [Candidatus Heimdallarchaeota archaeon LC_3]|uniref:Putative 50S ribosomal protein L13 n=1 Tax=uncultured organism TaxID=155900 RepID=A0A0F6PXI2_9ZZZZ|nr:putative 50S ribosomal protein L13 [uncultured organism]OLS27734.1 MAG: 50S ribosomal protein L13 [Candidatus Heimdallarchaeota archaeon LC_3]
MTLVIDATNMVLGRMATQTASILLEKKPSLTVASKEGNIDIKPTEHKKVYIINADKAVISGNPLTTTKRYLERIHKKTNTNPRRGPFHPRTPENIVKRAVRGMVPHRQYTGKKALGKLKVFVGTPSFLEETETIHFSDADASKFNCKRIFVGELARRIGSYRSRPLTVDKKVL